MIGVGGITTFASARCGEADEQCIKKPSIYLFDVDAKQLSLLGENAWLVCARGDTFAFVRGREFFFGKIGESVQSARATVDDVVSWDGCIPKAVTKGGGTGGPNGPIYSQSLRYYEFRGAFLDWKMGGKGEPTKLTWRYPGKEGEVVVLPVGPWNKAWLPEHYYATRSGFIVVARRDSYWVHNDVYRDFFPGYVNYGIEVSSSGCRIAFWGQVENNAPRPHFVSVC